MFKKIFNDSYIFLKVCIFILLMSTYAWAANTLLTALTSGTSIALTDIVYVVMNPGSTPVDRKVTVGELLKPIPVDTDEITNTAGSLGLSNSATARAAIGLTIDTDVQGYDATLDSLEAISYSANMLSFFAAADYSAMRTAMGVAIGSDVEAYNSNLAGINQGLSTTGTPTFTSVTVDTEVYDATGWNSDNTAPTKDAVRDKIEAMGAGHAAVTLGAGVDALTLSTQEIGTHANVEAVADAATGVASPGVTLYDSDSPGSDKEAAFLGAQYVDGADGAENVDIVLYSMSGGTQTLHARFDQSDGRWEFETSVGGTRFGLVAKSIDAGHKLYAEDSSGVSSIDMDTDYPNVCNATFRWYNADNDGDITMVLPGEPTCGGGSGTAVDGKVLTFFHDDATATDDLILDPKGTDSIKYRGTLLAAGEALICEAEGDSVTLIGDDSGASQVWLVVSESNGTTCVEESP